jgi:hypothetical protein
MGLARSRAMTRLVPVLIAAVALATGGCGSSGVAIDPVARAADVTSQAGGAHVALTVQVDVAGQPSPITMTAQGFFNYRRREGTLSMSMTDLPAAVGATAPSGSLQIDEIFKSQTIYIGSPLLAGKLPNGAQWMKLDLGRFGQSLGINVQQLASGQSNPAQLLEYLKATGGKIVPVGHELVRGVPTTHYSAVVDLNKAADVLPTANRAQLRRALAKLTALTGSSSIPVDVWVDAGQLVRRVAMRLSVSVGGRTSTTSLTMDLFGFGPTPSVTPPPQSEVYDATQSAVSGLSAPGG